MAVPAPGQFYNPNSNYGYKGIAGPWGAAKSYLDTYPGGLDAELNPEAYFTHLIGQRGYGGLDNNSTNVRNMYGRLTDSYKAARLKNNELTWRKFLDPIDFENTLNTMSAQDRNENSSNVAPGNVRWIPR